MKKFTCFFVLTFLAMSAFLYAQNGTRSIDYSAKTFGRGGVSIGFFDNTGLMMSNPAGLSFLEEDMIDVNAIVMLPVPHYKGFSKDANGNITSNVLNDKDGEKNVFVLPSASYVKHFKKTGFTFGAGFFTVGGMGADFMLLNQSLKDVNGNTQEIEYHSRYAVMHGGLSAAYKFTEKFSIGVSAHVVYSTIEFINPFTLPPSVLRGVMDPGTGMTFGQYFSAPRPQGLGYSELTSGANMKDLTTFSFSPKLGFAYKFSDEFSMGYSFTAPVKLNYKEGNSRLDMTSAFNDAFGRAVANYMQLNPGVTQQQATQIVGAQFAALGINPANGFIADYKTDNEFEVPMSFGIGCKYAPVKELRFGVDIEWINWSNSADEMKLTLTIGNNSNVNRLLGYGGINQAPLVVDFPLKWDDAVLFKIGAEYDISRKVTVRAGYVYGNNPIPSNTINPIIPAVIESHVSAGASFNIVRNFVINAAFEYGLNNDVTSSYSNLLGSEYYGSTTSLKNILGHISFNYIFR